MDADGDLRRDTPLRAADLQPFLERMRAAKGAARAPVTCLVEQVAELCRRVDHPKRVRRRRRGRARPRCLEVEA
jgi:hypothetical protein